MPIGLTFGPDKNLYVADNNNQILRYDGATGTFKWSDKTHELVDPSDAVIGIVEGGKWIRYSSRKK